MNKIVVYKINYVDDKKSPKPKRLKDYLHESGYSHTLASHAEVPKTKIAEVYLDGSRIVVDTDSSSLRQTLTAEIDKHTHPINMSPGLKETVELVLSESKSDMIVWAPWVVTNDLQAKDTIASGEVSSIINLDGRSIVHGAKPIPVEDPGFLGGLLNMLQRSSEFGYGSGYSIVEARS